jgi:hypothetical protein
MDVAGIKAMEIMVDTSAGALVVFATNDYSYTNK